jgi:cytochrome c peroxidase
MGTRCTRPASGSPMPAGVIRGSDPTRSRRLACASTPAAIVVLWTCALVLLVHGCAEPRVDGTFTQAEWARVQTLSPLPAVPPDTTNQYADDPRAAALGQMLFFERDYSGAIVTGDDGTNGGLGAVGQTGRISCESCHQAAGAFDDTRSMPDATSLGADWTGRNTPTALNAAFYDYLFWDGRADTLWAQALGPAESAPEMAGDRLRIAHVMFGQYRDLYDAIFEPDLDASLDPASADAARFPASGSPGTAAFDGMTAADQLIVDRVYANFGKAIEAYERLLVTRDTAFDRYAAGDFTALSPSARRGLALFIGTAACVQCHSGPFFTDQRFHNLGVPQMGPHAPATDMGRLPAIANVLDNPFNSAGAFSDDPEAGMARLGLLMPDAALLGTFRTKSLREISRTAPYMHDGAMATLRDVVVFYNQGGGTAPMHGAFVGTVDRLIRPLNLTDHQIDDLVAFLEALEGAPLPAALLMDTSR